MNVEVQLLCSQVTVSVEHLLRRVEALAQVCAHDVEAPNDATSITRSEHTLRSLNAPDRLYGNQKATK